MFAPATEHGSFISAYTAKAGLICHVLVLKLLMGKLAQMIAYDAVIEESGNIVDESIQKASTLALETGWYQATAELNPWWLKHKKQFPTRYLSSCSS